MRHLAQKSGEVGWYTKLSEQQQIDFFSWCCSWVRVADDGRVGLDMAMGCDYCRRVEEARLWSH